MKLIFGRLFWAIVPTRSDKMRAVACGVRYPTQGGSVPFWKRPARDFSALATYFTHWGIGFTRRNRKYLVKEVFYEKVPFKDKRR